MLMVGSVAGIVWTHSRGGMLALAAGMAPVLLRSRHRIKLLLVLALLGGGTMFLVRDTLFERWASINAESYEEDATAAQRMMMWRAAVAMWRDYPVFGVGFGSSNFIALSPRYSGDTQGRVAHNTYLQVLADSGILAFSVYLVLMAAAIWYLGRSAKRWQKKDGGLEIYPRSILSALVAFAVGSVFLSRVTFDYYYILLMMAASWRWLERNGLLAEAGAVKSRHSAPEPLPSPPLPGWPNQFPQPAGGGRLQPSPGNRAFRSAAVTPPNRNV
jgi:O-antigen ligase